MIVGDPAVEAIVHEDPTDEKRWAVLADALLGANDPRGQLIAMGAAGRGGELPRLVEIYEDELWGDAKYVADGDPFEDVMWTGGWQGALPEPLEASIELMHGRYGVVDGIAVTGLDEEAHVAKAVGAVLACPMGRFIRHVRLELGERFCGPSGQPNWDVLLGFMARANPRGLRSLEISSSGYQLSWTSSGNLGPLLGKTPHLESIYLKVGNIDLGKKPLDLPRLKMLMLVTGGLPGACVEKIAASSWPSLEELSLYFGRRDYGGDATAEQVGAMLRRTDAFPKLRHLGLANSEIPAALVDVLLSSPILPRLRTIDLTRGTLHDEELAPILARARALAHLEHLDVSQNYLSAAAVESLAAALPGVRILSEEQRVLEEGYDRYTEIGE